MNSEQLESLLLDHALGELSPAVAALLEAHLALDPVAARHATELTATVQLAQRAVATPVASTPRVLDLTALARVQRAARSTARRLEFFRLAACVALGLGLGWLARPTPAPANSQASTAVPATFAPLAPADPRSTFWSVARLTATQRPPTATGTTQRLPLH